MRNFNIVLFIFFLLVSSIYATPVRMIGMGSLNLIVDDESNKINIFDYGKNVAGLYDDERGSSIESYVTYGNIKYADSTGTIEPEITYWGVSLPSYFDITMNPITAISGIPIGAIFTYRMEDRFAFSGTGAYSSTKTKYESTDTEYDASWPTGSFLASKNFGLYSAGASGGYTKMRFTNNQNGDEIYATLKVIDGGTTAHLSPMLELGISGGFAIPDAGLKSEFLGQKHENTFKGNAYSVGVQGIAKVPGLLKMGTKFNFLNANLDGKTEVGNASYDIGEVSAANFELGSRLLFSSILFPIKVGANLNYIRLHPVYNSNDTILSNVDNTISTTNFGLGVGYEMPLFIPGIQYDLYRTTSTDNSLNGETTNSTLWDLRFGGEVNLTFVTLRGGYIITKNDPNKDVEDDESNSRNITCGIGIQPLMQPFKIEVAYVNKETKPADNPTEQKETENTIYTAFKMRF